MAKVEFWLRHQGDRRPVCLLKQDTPGELLDFEEIPTGHVYPIVGLHDAPGMSVLQPRDLANPMFVLSEIVRGILNVTAMREKYANDSIAHAELVTDEGRKILFTEIGLGQVASPKEEVYLLGVEDDIENVEPELQVLEYLPSENHIRWLRVILIVQVVLLVILVGWIVWGLVGGR